MAPLLSVRKMLGRRRRALSAFVTTLRRTVQSRADLRYARQALLASDTLQPADKALLQQVSTAVHGNDTMYDRGEHYLRAGLSAIRAIDTVLAHRGESSVKTILDFPSGCGRVLRFLRARFPDAAITAGEIDRSMLEFCRAAFGVSAVQSHADIKKVALADSFDLIWCGSLLTHIDETASLDILRFFYDHLAPGGVCIFTTHGPLAIGKVEDLSQTHGLTQEQQGALVHQFKTEGYAYVDYLGAKGYGISGVSYNRMVELAKQAGDWREVCYLDHAWDNYQDVYAFAHCGRP